MKPVLWASASLGAALLLSAAWFALTGYWVYASEFAEGFGALARGKNLDAAGRQAAWSSGYRIQYFFSYLLPVLHGGSVAWIQRRIFPEQTGALALLAILPGTFLLMLVSMLVLYDSVAAFVVVASFLSCAAILTRDVRRVASA